MRKLIVMAIFGTRPEVIKMAPVIIEFNNNPAYFKTVVCVTAQHRYMLDQALPIFNIKPDIDLNLMRNNQTLHNLTSKTISSLTKIIKKIKPDLVLIQGDTTTAFVSALSAFYLKVKVAHIEAGLRTNDKYNPFPEEINRRLISALTDFHFAPTKTAMEALLKENINEKRIFLTGNTVIDALHIVVKKPSTYNHKLDLSRRKKLIFVTAHRRENFGKPISNICIALKELAKRNADIEIVYPVHLNPNIKKPVWEFLKNVERITLLPPLGYHELAHFLKRAYIVLTDSGGLQEEAPTFGKPVLVLREKTERPEGIEAKAAKVVGTEVKSIVTNVEELLRNEQKYNLMSKAVSPYGDGKAAKRIVSIIKRKRKEILS